LAKIEVGTDVEVEYFKKGVKKEVTKITAVTSAPQAQAPAPQQSEVSAGPKCNVCGKALKDGKYKTCFMCNKKKQAEKPAAEAASTEAPKASYSKSNYGSAEDVAGKEVGCAAGCAASILAGRQEQPEVLLEYFRVLMNGILEHIRASK